MRVAPLKYNRMACDPLILPEQIHLLIDGDAIPVSSQSVGDLVQIFLPTGGYEIKVPISSGRIIHAELSADFSFQYPDIPFMLPHYWGQRPPVPTNPISYWTPVYGNAGSPGVYITYPPGGPSNPVGFHFNATRVNPICGFSIQIPVMYGNFCPVVCKYSSVRVPSSRVLSITDIQNKVYLIEGYQYIGCASSDQIANNHTASAISKAINKIPTSCQPYKSVKVKVTAQSASLLLCGLVEVIDSPVKLKSIQMGDGKSYLFEKGGC